MPDTVNTVTGPIRVEQLGTTLMHEHLVIGYSGENADGLESSTSRADRIAICVDQVYKLQDHGIASMLDPCPSNLGRDMDLAGEVGARTGFQIVMATGLYRELEDAPGDDASMAERIADLFMKELEDGVGDAGVKPGVIKVGTYEDSISPYEYEVLRAAAIASKTTDAPITTHTQNGVMGREQQAFLKKEGVPAHRIIIGHSCGNTDPNYHQQIAEEGSYVSFDRFGIDEMQPDERRIKCLATFLKNGFAAHAVVSHDSVMCTRGSTYPPDFAAALDRDHCFDPTHFLRNIVPELRKEGVTDAQINTVLVDNPRRYFAGDALPA